MPAVNDNSGTLPGAPLRGDAVFARFIGYSGLLYISLWIIGLGGAFWPVVALASACYLVYRGSDRLSLLPLTIAVLILFSIPVGVAYYESGLGRVVGSLGNLSVWIGLSAILVCAQKLQIRIPIAKSLVVITAFQGVVVLSALLFFPHDFPLPIRVIPESILPEGLAVFSSQEIVYMDWLGGEALRTVGVSGNPTWAGALALAGMAAAVVVGRRTNVFLSVLSFGGGILTISLSLSRSVLIVALVASVVAVASRLRRRLGGFVYLIMAAGGMAVFFLSYLNFEWLRHEIMDINDDRMGSLESRSDIYRATLDGILDHPLLLVGYGIKPSSPDLVASLATHSTYLSLLFRGGIVAPMLFLALGGVLLWSCWKRFDSVGSFIVVFIVLWSSLEDIDGGHLLPLALALAVVSPTHQNEDKNHRANSGSLGTDWLRTEAHLRRWKA